jgi:hypothetical protein
MNKLQTLIATAKDLDPETSAVEEIAETACELASYVNNAQKALDPLKGYLRALTGTTEGAHVHYSTPSGQVSVTFPKPRYVARKGVSWETLRAQLGDKFDLYFTTTVKYAPRKDIDEVLRVRTASEEFGAVLDVVEREEPTPRVGFKPTS